MDVQTTPPFPHNADVEQDGLAGHGIRILLADSQAIYRVGMKKIFAVEDDIRVVSVSVSVQASLSSIAKWASQVAPGSPPAPTPRTSSFSVH